MTAGARDSGLRRRWSALTVSAVVAVLGFAWQRHTSPFLQVGRRVVEVGRLADALGVDAPTVQAVWCMRGADQPEAEVFEAMSSWRPLSNGLGEGPALVAVLGDREAVVAARAHAGSDREAVWELLATPANRNALRRFRALRERFAQAFG